MFEFWARGHQRAGLPPCREKRLREHHPSFEGLSHKAWRDVQAAGALADLALQPEGGWARDMGLTETEGLDPIFSRGEKPHFSGMHTFLRAPFAENIRDFSRYDAAVVGVPFEIGMDDGRGARFAPQSIRRISGLYAPYNFETGLDLREHMTLCDAGDIYAVSGKIEKCFDQISRGVRSIFSAGAMPIVLGGENSIGYPTLRGIAECTSKRIGLIHIGRHRDMLDTEARAKMMERPSAWAQKLPNVMPKNVVQLGCGSLQGQPEKGGRGVNVVTVDSIERTSLKRAAELALERAWNGTDAVYLSFDVECVDCGPSNGMTRAQPGGFSPQEALQLVGLVSAKGLCGMDVVGLSPAYDGAHTTSLFATRVVFEALEAMVAKAKVGTHRAIIDKRGGRASSD